MDHDDLTIRLSTDQDGDDESIRRLASLEDAELPRGPVMLAELRGEPSPRVGWPTAERWPITREPAPGCSRCSRFARLETRAIVAVWGA